MTNTFRIEGAGEADVAELADVAARTFPLACPPGTLPADVAAFVAANLSAERFTDYLRDPARIVLIARGSGGAGDAASEAERVGVDDGTGAGPIVGYAMVVLGEPADPDVAAAVIVRPTGELSKCYVLPEWHGRGVAAALIARASAEAGRLGAAGLWLGVNQLNARARAAYTKAGFAVVGARGFQVGDQRHDDWVMERRIDR